MGNDVAHSSLVGNPFSAAIIYWILYGIGFQVSVHTISLYFPIFMAACTCVAVYYLAKDMGGKTTGFLAASLVAINPAYLSRTNFGFFDTENIAVFGLVATSLSLLRSIEPEKPFRVRFLYAVLGGLALDTPS